MKKQLFLLLFSVLALVGQARVVTGTVIQASDGEPVIGGSVTIKGVAGGVVTDYDGKYSIDVPNDASVLCFSFVGLKSQEIKVGSQSVIDVVLEDNTEVLNEVVVTAMGQSQQKSKLNFSVQELKSEDVTAGSSSNFVSTLQGKVAGVQVSMAGGSPNSASQIVIRAISSINPSQSNEPLFVIDGMPVRGGASSIADINPNDIESMSVLKGAAASALYGQEGANGVILITTKSGKNGKVEVNASASLEISNTAHMPAMQRTFKGGSNGFYVTNANGGWGPRMDEGDTYYDNVGNFLGTGFMQKYDMSLSGGNDLFSAYASVNYMSNKGIVPQDYKNRMGIFVKGEFNPSSTVKVLMSANYIDNTSRGFGNSMSTIYGWAINRDMSDYRLTNGLPNWGCRYDDWDILTDAEKLGATLSPYYGRYMDESKTEGQRVILNASLQWEPIKNLTLTAKFAYDKSWSTYNSMTVPRYAADEFKFDESGNTIAGYDEDGNVILGNGSITSWYGRMGTYDFSTSRGQRLTVQGLANYLWPINENFNVNFFLGGEYTESHGISGSFGGKHFMLEGDFHSFNNLDPNIFSLADNSMSRSESNKYGYFGEVRFDYRSVIQLSATGRLDGSSTFKQMETPHYFYPSFTGGIIFSELFHLQSPVFSYGKIRGNYAKVGKDAPANQFDLKYKQWLTIPDSGFAVNPGMSRATTLDPEMTSTWEIGADLRFFNNRTRLDLAYYNTTVDNQIVVVYVSPTSGTILQTRNEGSIRNEGIEATLHQDIFRTKDFEWTAYLNFSLNRGKMISLPDGVSYIANGTSQYSDIYTTCYLGESTTGIVGTDYLRNEAGQVLVDENGYPRISPDKYNYLGNREPDCLLGLGSNFRWKDLSLSFLVDGRVGGKVANLTVRGLMSNGMSEYIAQYRNHKVVFDGVVEQPDGTYVQNTTPVILDQQTYSNYIGGVASNFIEDGSYLRLSYVTVGYDFSNLLKRFGSANPIKGLRASITGRNLLLLTKYTGCDPQVMPGAVNGTGAMGIDYYSVPSTRSFNFNLNVTF